MLFALLLCITLENGIRAHLTICDNMTIYVPTLMHCIVQYFSVSLDTKIIAVLTNICIAIMPINSVQSLYQIQRKEEIKVVLKAWDSEGLEKWSDFVDVRSGFSAQSVRLWFLNINRLYHIVAIGKWMLQLHQMEKYIAQTPCSFSS